MSYPSQVQALQDAVFELPGISTVKIEKFWLGDLKADELSLSGPYAFLPHAALRRTNGGIQDELLLRIWYTVNETQLGWRAIELLAWMVRDRARSGQNIQMLALAFPVIIGGELQTKTLSFAIDLFYCDPENDNEKFLLTVAELAKGFTDVIREARALKAEYYSIEAAGSAKRARRSLWSWLFTKSRSNKIPE